MLWHQKQMILIKMTALDEQPPFFHYTEGKNSGG